MRDFNDFNKAICSFILQLLKLVYIISCSAEKVDLRAGTIFLC